MASAGTYVASIVSASAKGTGSANPAGLRLLTSVDGVNTPPKSTGMMKFSFANPEPSVEFGGLLFAFEVITYENNYGIAPSAVTVVRDGDGLRLKATALRWAGGQEERPGMLMADLRRTANGAIEWFVSASLDTPIKSLKTIVRGLPCGRLSTAADEWRDTGDKEVAFEYPALMGGMATPLVAIESRDGHVWGISSLQTEVRPARFTFLPGPDGYKTELLYEQAAWLRRSELTSCQWRILPGPDFSSVARAHFDTVTKNWGIPKFLERRDAPEWMKHVSLVLSLHGEHWTGYVHNDFARQLEILRWVAKQIDPKTVMVFLAGWDGRYYWDYPNFEVGARTGGEAAFRKLISAGKALGYRFALMFGSNVANPAWPQFATIADARIRAPYGDFYPADFVDWDGDRKGDGSMVFMNLAVASWREHLARRISDMISRYAIDAYFLDICGLWENNLQGDMHLGLRQLVNTLASRHPGVAPIGEMLYDAQMAFIPMNHVPRYALIPDESFDRVPSFRHLSWPSPGTGSTGVHEYGFNTYKPVTLEQREIPTITFVDDTFSKRRDLVMRDIATARGRFEARKRLT